MSKSDVCENSLLLLLFNNVNFANVGDATGVRGSTAAGSFYISLHTADPAEGGNQASNEAAYGGYARVAVNRASGAGGWTITGNSVSPGSNITFPGGTSGSGTATHWGVGTALSGAGVLLYSGTISPTIALGNGITPVLQTGSAITED